MTGEDAPRRFGSPVLVLVAAGGAIGSLLRHLLGEWNPAVGGFPIGTFIANITGAFGLGLVVILLQRPGPRLAKPLVVTGFFGAYTTFSTFAVETVRLVHDGHLPMAAVYSLGSLAAGLGAATIGLALGRRVSAQPSPSPS